MATPHHTTRWRQAQRRLLAAAVMLPLFALVHLLAFWLRFDGQFSEGVAAILARTLPWALLIKLVVFSRWGVCQDWRRYVTFHDLTLLIKATTVASLLLTLGVYLSAPGLYVPRSVFLMDWGGTIVIVGGLRALSRLARERVALPFMSGQRTSAFIVGANDSGESLLRAIYRNAKLSYHVVGFIAEGDRPLESHIAGVPILGTLEQSSDLVEQYGVEEVLITAGELSGRQVRELVGNARDNNVRVKVLPSYEQILADKVAMRPRDVSIEDLLHRDPVELDMSELHAWIDDRVLLVTGSAGSIGSEICRQLLQFRPRRLVLLDRSENGQFFIERELRQLADEVDVQVCIADITDAARMESVFRQYRPDIVFHAAAFKHVPLMESNPGEAVKNIACATRTLADLADRFDVSSFVMISTDKAVNPTSVMGANKRVAELYVQSLARHCKCRFVTVRFGNVLDSAGSVVPVFREQIARGGPVCVTHPDMVRFFMTIPEASQLVIQAGAMGRGGEIFVLDMGEPVRIVDLATDMIRLSGLEVDDDVEIRFIGLRPGEKLFEELHSDNENRKETAHPKIMVAECEVNDLFAVSRAIDHLAAAAERPRETIVAELQDVVPTYHPDAAPVVRRKAA